MKTKVKFHEQDGLGDFTADFPHLFKVGDVLCIRSRYVVIEHLVYDLDEPEAIYWVGLSYDEHPTAPNL